MPFNGTVNVLIISGASRQLSPIPNAERALVVAVVSGVAQHVSHFKPDFLRENGPSAYAITGVSYDAFRRGDAISFRPCLLVVVGLDALHVGGFLENDFEHVLESFFLPV